MPDPIYAAAFEYEVCTFVIPDTVTAVPPALKRSLQRTFTVGLKAHYPGLKGRGLHLLSGTSFVILR